MVSNEGQAKEGNSTTQTKENPNGRNNTAVPETIRFANEAAERMEKAAARLEQANIQALEIESRRILGGESGMNKPVEKKELSPKEYAKLILQNKIPE